jgi:hypothetical protein
MNLLPYFPVAPLLLPPTEEDTSVRGGRRLLVSGFNQQALLVPLSQVVLEHSADRYCAGLVDLVTNREKPSIVPEHVTDLHGVFEDLRDGIPQTMLNHHFLSSPRFVVWIDNPNIHHRLVVDPETLSPQFRPLRLFQVAGSEVLRLHHQQRVKMRMRAAVSSVRDFYAAYPPDSREHFQLGETGPRTTHHTECEAEQMHITVLNGEGSEKETSLGIVSNQPWQRPMDSCLPHEGTSPLANRTTSHPAKARVLQLQLLLPGLSRRVAGEADVLATLAQPFRIAVVPGEGTRRKDFGDVVGFSPVGIPPPQS